MFDKPTGRNLRKSKKHYAFLIFFGIIWSLWKKGEKESGGQAIENKI